MKIPSNIKAVALTLAIIFSNASYASAQSEKDMVIAQMNYCITTLTNIVHNKSMTVLEHESDQLLNNLTMEQIIGLYEINDFRIELLDAVSRFEITEEERALLRRLQSIKRDNMKWAAISNALNPTMLLTGNAGPGMGYQLAFQTLLTTARSAVEYKTMQGEQNIEELRAMWDLRKEDLNTINDVRKTALSIVFSLYNKYHLSENDRLTEATANLFSNYISDPDAAKRVRLLEDHRKTYEQIAEYYYHLGMGYVDLGQYDKAKPNFVAYLNMYKKAPILRYDEKSGCIALTRLSYEKNLSNKEKEQLINIALQNLPSNSAAVLQCAMVYLYELKDEKKGFDLIRMGIDDPNASDHNLLFMAAAKLLPMMAKYPVLNMNIQASFSKNSGINFDSYITFLINAKENAWENISKIISFNDVSYRKWYHLWIGTHLNDELHIILPERISYNVGDISIYIENHKAKKVTIQQLRTAFTEGVTLDEIEDIDCFKANKDLKYLYFETLIPDKVFMLKKNIDYEKIRKEEWPRMSEFSFSDDNDDIKDNTEEIKENIEEIIDFCKSHAPKSYDTNLECEEWGNDYINKGENNGAKIKFSGDSLRYRPYHSTKQEGYYLRIVFANGINLMYKYDSDDKDLKPYLYSVSGRTVFANIASKDEYQCTIIEKKESWWEKIWKTIKSWFSDEDAKDTTPKTNEPSWWSKTWNSICDFFASDDDSKDKEND